jgi:hypothetical protein
MNPAALPRERFDELADIATMVRRLRPDWRNAESFYELRSEIIGALMRLARPPPPIPLRPALPARPSAPQPLAIVRKAVLAVPAPSTRRHRTLKRRHRYPRPPACPAQGVLVI